MHHWSDRPIRYLTRPALRRAMVLTLAALGLPATTTAQPNVLLIIADDLNRKISPLGDPDAITPNLERLAARSVSFTNATCQFPFCSPSRAALFMGLYPWQTGNFNSGAAYPNPHAVFPDRVGLPEYFRNHGYWTASYGKTEHLYQPRNWDLQTTDFRYSPWRADYDPALLVHSDTITAQGITGQSHVRVYDLPPNDFVDGVSASAAIADLTAHLTSPDPPPFFVVVGFEEPHAPWEVPQSIYEQYGSAALTIPDNPRGNWPHWAWKVHLTHLEPITEDRRRDLFHAYLSSVTMVDYQTGRLLDFLDQQALWDDTVVVFFSDNGFSLCEHSSMYAKINITRENLSVPLFIHTPDGDSEGATCARQVELQDLFPTLIDLCGLPAYPRYLAGRSIKPLLLDSAAPWPHVSKAVLGTPNASYAIAKVAQFGSLKIAQGGTPNDMYIDHDADPEELAASLYSPADRPDDPAWMPLHDCLDNDFGFVVGQSRIFYSRHSNLAPDRDADGVRDSDELALAPVGFTLWNNDSDKWFRLTNGPEVAKDPQHPGNVAITLPGFVVDRPQGYDFVTSPLDIFESEDLQTWRPSDAEYQEDGNGMFRWTTPGEPATKKFFRFRVPQS